MSAVITVLMILGGIVCLLLAFFFALATCIARPMGRATSDMDDAVSLAIAAAFGVGGILLLVMS